MNKPTGPLIVSIPRIIQQKVRINPKHTNTITVSNPKMLLNIEASLNFEVITGYIFKNP